MSLFIWARVPPKICYYQKKTTLFDRTLLFLQVFYIFFPHITLQKKPETLDRCVQFSKISFLYFYLHSKYLSCHTSGMNWVIKTEFVLKAKYNQDFFFIYFNQTFDIINGKARVMGTNMIYKFLRRSIIQLPLYCFYYKNIIICLSKW